MRRAFLIAAALAYAFQIQASEKSRFRPELQVQGEYRRDVLDYDEVEKQFTRERATLAFGRKSAVNLTHVYIGASGENRFTGNVTVRDFSEIFNSVVGNYYINFGAGLLVGKKRLLSPDLFSRKLIMSMADIFSPCNSGNPLFCFQGIASSLSFSFSRISLSLSSFLSIKSRYTGNQAYLSDQSEFSFNSIITRTRKDYRHAEPVEINDYGGAVETRIGDRFLLQNYFIYSDMRRNKNSLIWNFSERGALASADKAFYGCGVYACYHDEYITIFCEFGIPNRKVWHEGGRITLVRGYGAAYGIRFRHPVCRLSLSGKNTDRAFCSLYSSGNGYAEHAFMADVSIDPLKQLTIGAGFLGENKISPGFNETFLSRRKRETAFLIYHLAHKGRVLLKLNYLTNEKRFGSDHFLQFYSSIKYYVLNSILLSLSGKIQKKAGRVVSGSIHPGIGLTLWNCVSIFIYYSRYFIAGDNYIYSAVSPIPGSISPGTFIKASSNSLLAKISVRYKELVFSVRYEHRFSGKNSIQNRIELYGRCLF